MYVLDLGVKGLRPCGSTETMERGRKDHLTHNCLVNKILIRIPGPFSSFVLELFHE